MANIFFAIMTVSFDIGYPSASSSRMTRSLCVCVCVCVRVCVHVCAWKENYSPVHEYFALSTLHTSHFYSHCILHSMKRDNTCTHLPEVLNSSWLASSSLGGAARMLSMAVKK